MKRRQSAFTLIEVLVALAVMAVLAGLAWRGLDGMLRAREGSQAAVERTARLNTVLSQWEQDLAALHDTGVLPPLAFDGQTLRLTRTAPGGVSLVAWSLYGGSWQRWASSGVTRAAPLQDAWLRSQQLVGNEAGQVKLLDGVTEWQLYFYRGNAWTNAQSTGDLAETAPPPPPPQPPATPASGVPQPPQPQPQAQPREALPDGVRMVVSLGEATLTRDLVLAPQRP